jgi:hypothetical protein
MRVKTFLWGTKPYILLVSHCPSGFEDKYWLNFVLVCDYIYVGHFSSKNFFKCVDASWSINASFEKLSHFKKNVM